jgi:manganese/iron transport system permease protein
MMLIASFIGVLSVWLGLMISYYWSTAGSATMAVIPVLIFFLLLVTRPLWRRTQKSSQVISHG